MGELDGKVAVITGAGIGAGGPPADLDMADYDRVLDVDPRGVLPGAIVTEGMCGGWQTFSPEIAEKAALGRSEEVAELASFLASDRASYLSGCVIPADGGWSCQLA